MDGQLIGVPINQEISNLTDVSKVYRQLLLINKEIKEYNKTHSKKRRLMIIGEIFEEHALSSY